MIVLSFFQRLFPRRLWQQIFLILFCLVVIPIAVIGTILINSSQRALQENVERNLQQITEHSTGEVFKEYEGAVKALTATSAILGTLNNDAWRQETVAVELSLRFPAFRSVASVGLNGQEIASSRLSEPLRKNISSDVFVCAQSGKTCASDVRIASDHTPVMDLAVPIYRLGKVQAVLMAEYSLRGVWDVVDRIQFGSGEEVFLVDSKGRIIAHPDKKQVLKNAQFPYPNVIKDVLSGNSGSRQEKDVNKQAWMVAYAPVRDLHWGLVAAQPSAKAFAFIHVLRMHSWIMLLFILYAVVSIALLLTNRMSRPIEQLMGATKRLARGDVEVSLPVLRRDEMGKLMFAFNTMTEQLKRARHVEKLSMVGRSATAIAHELKNSLTLVKTFVQLMPERAHDEAFVRQSSQTILGELDSWNTMLQNLMDFTKKPAPLKLSVMDANRVVGEVARMVEPKAEKMRVHFLVDLSASVPAIEADPQRVKQVLIHLIINAFEATTPGATVVVSTNYVNARSGGGHLELSVSNTGEGIPEEHLSKIFDPFFTTKENGLGLGLSICREIVHRHGGRLEAKSQAGQGAVFMMKFPVYPVLKEERGEYDFRENSRRR